MKNKLGSQKLQIVFVDLFGMVREVIIINGVIKILN